MKFFLKLAFAAALFLFVLVKSNALEIQITKESRKGAEYYVSKHQIHWDRFWGYLQNECSKVGKFITKKVS